MKYLLFLPKDYGKKDQAWPLILFLHGAGERGDNLEVVKKHGPPKIVEQKPDFPFIVVSPQCPGNSWWTEENDALLALLDDMIARYRVDPDRIYLTGLSMGGYGTWKLASDRANRFAAIVPICGGGEPRRAMRLRNMPVWVFHGGKDPVVPVKESEDMVNALKKAGNKEVKFTVYPEAQHDSWVEAYNTQELYDWLLQHKRVPGAEKEAEKKTVKKAGKKAEKK
jgi:predicted peptidase